MGVRTVMLTGDRPEVAAHIGEKAGIGGDPRLLLSGKQIARMALSDVARQSEDVSIFARLAPSQKGIVVRLLQRQGHGVAMVGDGANDAIALRAADVGISFVEDSSPFARRASRILIRELADVWTVMRSARRMERWRTWLTVFRVSALVGMVLGWYAWVLR